MLKNGLNKDFLENGSNDFANIGNLNETMILFQMEVVPFSGTICIMSYGAILDDPESEFWILSIILEMAQ